MSLGLPPRLAALVWLLPLLAACQEAVNATAAAEASTRASLLAQRDAISNWQQFAAGANVSGWDEEAPVCTWTGVTCPAGNTLSGFNLSLACYQAEPEAADGRVQVCAGTPATGTLAPELASISSLAALDLHGQQFVGTLPAAWSTLPQLDLLNLGHNSLTGTLPESWAQPGALPQLTGLFLQANQLTGTYSTAWAGNTGGLGNVTNLSLASNRLTGTLPNTWRLHAILSFELQENLFSGRLPTGNFTSLPSDDDDEDPGGRVSFVNFSSNALTGSLPSEWGGPQVFSSLHVMDLSNNRLTGTLPREWSFQYLEVLVLSFNGLTGAIPHSWGYRTSFPELTTLDLTGNKMCGAIPSGLPYPLCSDGTDNCVNGTACSPPPPAAPPPPAPVPCDLCSRRPPPPSPQQPSSSSVPVGAIVGGVLGGLALLAVLAFLALRPRKGWLRKQQLPHGKSLSNGTGKRPPDSNGSGSGSGVPAGLPPQPGDSASSAALMRLGSEGSAQLNDPVISYIASHLSALRRASLTRRHARSDAGSSTPPRTPASGSLDSASLTPEVRQWEVQWEDIHVARLVGRGGFGRVYLASWRQTPVAVKVLTKADEVTVDDLILPESVLRELQEEASVMTRLRHPNVVSFMGLCLMPPLIVTEFCERGSLYDVLRQARQADAASELTWELRLHIALDAARGLLYLHCRVPQIVHRDVKSPNLLVDQAWRCKVADFNLSKIFGAAGDTEGPSNPVWLAPEVALHDAEASTASDVFSFGMVMYELLTWRLPWEDYNPFQIMFALGEGRRPAVPTRAQLPGPDTLAFAGLDAYCELMRECWAEAPADRPTFDDVVPRLNRLLQRLPPAGGSNSAGRAFPSSGAATQPEAEGDVGSPLKRWGTAPIV